ncbi:MAG: aminopeptidase [Planctomycetota bacterium]|jgi:aminopeptidase
MVTPSKAVLSKYADVMINFALNSGKGMKRGEVVYLVTQMAGLPLAKEVYRTILASGGYPLVKVVDDEFQVIQLKNSSNKQLSFYPEKLYTGMAESIDHWVRILGDEDPMYLKDCDPKKIMLQSKSVKPFRDLLDAKENRGEFTWTLCLYGTPGMAKEAGLSEQAYWNEIKKACFLGEKDPVAKWKSVFKDMNSILRKINKLDIKRVHVEAKNTDLWVTIGDKRQWLGGSGRNIPSFEIFTSPDWRGTEGTIFFDQPLYRYGNIIRDIQLTFKDGKVVKATAKKNEKLLREMIKQPNADKVGEFSLTDKRFSKIGKFMANTLYDENFGGRFGNTHLAVGKSYQDTYTGNLKRATEKTWERLGYNDSPVHTDIIATSNRKVTAELANGKTRVIYENGEFSI